MKMTMMMVMMAVHSTKLLEIWIAIPKKIPSIHTWGKLFCQLAMTTVLPARVTNSWLCKYLVPVVYNMVGGKILSFGSQFCSHTQHIANYRDNSEKSSSRLENWIAMQISRFLRPHTEKSLKRFGSQFKNLTFSLMCERP